MGPHFLPHTTRKPSSVRFDFVVETIDLFVEMSPKDSLVKSLPLKQVASSINTFINFHRNRMTRASALCIPTGLTVHRESSFFGLTDSLFQSTVAAILSSPPSTTDNFPRLRPSFHQPTNPPPPPPRVHHNVSYRPYRPLPYLINHRSTRTR